MRGGAALLLALLVAAAPACRSEPEPSAGLCPHVFWRAPSRPDAYVEVVGDFNEWKRPGLRLAGGRADGYMMKTTELPPGELRYVFYEDGTRVLDEAVGTTAFEAGEEVTLAEVRDCARAELSVAAVTRTGDAVTAKLTLAAGSLDAASIEAEGLEASTSGGELTLVWRHEGPGKRRVLVRARDDRGRPASRWITLWQEADPSAPDFELRDAIVYQIMVDRYADAAGPLAAPQMPSERAGGTLAGVTRAIERGAFGHANVLWLSPLYQNPEGLFPGTDGRQFSSYHGYWPVGPRAVDARLGSEADLDALVAAAHARGLRVVLDVVPNHVHEQSPYAKEPRFLQDETCVCGTPGCDWAEKIESCRFAPYLPDLNWRNDALARTITEDVAWWVERFDLDGVRIDAVPMMPRAATRRIGRALRDRFEHAGAPMWLIGENFTGPGSYAQLRYYLGPDGLDTEFHFPLMWALRGALARGDEPMRAISDVFAAGEEAWGDAGAVMGNMIGNHDVARFASVTAGDADGDGFVPAATSREKIVYDRQLQALGLVFALPGAPFVYYGDEVALAGRQDPDSRRVMPSDDALTTDQQRVREGYRALARLRACAEPLRRGAVSFPWADRERLVLTRTGAGGRTALVVATRSALGPTTLEIPLPGVPEGRYVDALSGQTLEVRSALTVLPAAASTIHVFLPENDPCLP